MRRRLCFEEARPVPGFQEGLASLALAAGDDEPVAVLIRRAVVSGFGGAGVVLAGLPGPKAELEPARFIEPLFLVRQKAVWKRICHTRLRHDPDSECGVFGERAFAGGNQALVGSIEFAGKMIAQRAMQWDGRAARRVGRVVAKAHLLLAAFDRGDDGVEGFHTDDAGETGQRRDAIHQGSEDASEDGSGGREEQACGDERGEKERDGYFPTIRRRGRGGRRNRRRRYRGDRRRIGDGMKVEGAGAFVVAMNGARWRCDDYDGLVGTEASGGKETQDESCGCNERKSLSIHKCALRAAEAREEAQR